MIDIGEKKEGGKLFIVSTPIGNKGDFTQRALGALKICDAVICEERKVGARILRDINISKDLYELNEQNEDEEAPYLIAKIVAGEKLALISDCGTPLFADPGSFLLKLALQNDLDVEVIPGVTSIMTALVRSGMNLESFLYAGFLNRDPIERIKELEALSQETRTVCLLETPYRFNQLIEACAEVMPERRAYIGMNLTMRYETHHYGTFKEIKEKFADQKVKAEFVLVFDGAPKGYKPQKKAYGKRRSSNYQDRDSKFNKFDRNKKYDRDDRYKGSRDNRRDDNYRRDKKTDRDDRYKGGKSSDRDDRYKDGKRSGKDEGYKGKRSYGKDDGYKGKKSGRDDNYKGKRSYGKPDYKKRNNDS